jgi:reactive intermediate/imine deaminase
MEKGVCMMKKNRIAAGILAIACGFCISGCGDSGESSSTVSEATTTVAEVLKAAGASFDNVVKTTCFLKDVAKDFAAFNEIYAEAMGDNKPARSCVGVAELPKGVLVEVEVIAVLD